MNTKITYIGFAFVACLSACSSLNEEVSERSGLPAWTLNPTVEGGIAATDCVVYSGNLSVDRKMATANSRTTLAQQISLKIDVLDRSYLSGTNADKESMNGTTFSSVSKQLTQQMLSGSRVIKADIVEIRGVDHFCVLTAITPKVTDALFRDIVKGSKRELSATEEKLLRQELMAYKAERSLEVELEKVNRAN
jgi:hypothetical protein